MAAGARKPLPWRYVALGAFTVAASLFILAPLAIVVVNSFNNVAYTVFPPEGFSTRWYANLFAQDVFYAAAWRSILLATLSTAIALAIGIMAAYALVRYRLPVPDLTKAFLLSPIVLLTDASADGLALWSRATHASSPWRWHPRARSGRAVARIPVPPGDR